MFNPGDLLRVTASAHLWDVVYKPICLFRKNDFCICLADPMPDLTGTKYVKVLSSFGIGNVNCVFVRLTK